MRYYNHLNKLVYWALALLAMAITTLHAEEPTDLGIASDLTKAARTDSNSGTSTSTEKTTKSADDEPVIGKNTLKVSVAVPKTFKIVRGMYLAFLPRYKKESIYNVSVTEDPAFELMFLHADAKTEEQRSRYKFKTIDRFNKNYVDNDEGSIIKSFVTKPKKKEKVDLFRFNKDNKLGMGQAPVVAPANKK